MEGGGRKQLYHTNEAFEHLVTLISTSLVRSTSKQSKERKTKRPRPASHTSFNMLTIVMFSQNQDYDYGTISWKSLRFQFT